MTKTDNNFCRICLTTNKHDNVSDSSCYTTFFIQLLNTKEFKDKLWLCMWCKTTLRKSISLMELALQTEKILNSKHEINADTCHRTSLHSLSRPPHSHIDIPPTTVQLDEKDIIILNVNNSKEESEINEIYIPNEIVIENQFMNESLDDIKIKNDLELNKNQKIKSIHTTESLDAELENQNYEYKTESMSKINENEIKLETEIEISTKGNKRQLKLNELKFEMRYLNLEEQLNEIEIKKMKYKDMKFQCELCGIGFLTNDYLEEHKIRHTEMAGPYKCSICSLHFKKQLVHSQHTLAHRRVFSCLICGARITKWSNCAVHRQKCGGMVIYVECQLCPKVFSDEHSLKVHARTHSARARYSCDHCARHFTTKQRLRVHIRSHTGVKPFTCEHCSRRFSTHSNLKAHGAVHTDVSTHYCVECNTYYKTAKSLRRHLAESVRHVRDRHYMFSCKECSRELSSAKALQHHLERHSLTTHVKCTHCDKTFSNKSNLNKHLKCIHRTNI